MAEAVVLVNGLPGAGKTTLAHRLAAGTGWPALSKDAVKESLALLAPAADPRRLGAIAVDTVWAVAAASRGTVVVESWWFRPRDLEFARAGLLSSGAPACVELWCEAGAGRAGVQEARRRYASRRRAAVHDDARRLEQDWTDWAARAEPLALGPVLRVDTSTPVDLAGLIARLTPLF